MKKIILSLFMATLFIGGVKSQDTLFIFQKTGGISKIPVNNIDSMTFAISRTVTDIDGNVYHTITIGTQTWMVENLKVTHYRDGSVIPSFTSMSSWSALTTGAFCDHSNTASNANIYGHLYNWYAATDSRNIAPTGWHVPSDAEWTTLATYLGGETVAGGKLKEIGTSHWYSPNTGATNSTGFTALGGGYYQAAVSNFISTKEYGRWWTSSSISTTNAWDRNMNYYYNNIFRDAAGAKKVDGLSIRCIKD